MPASHAGGRRFEPASPHQSRASTRKRVAGTLLFFQLSFLRIKFSANALNMRSGARRAPGLFCLFKALKPAFYAFAPQGILSFSPFGKEPSKTCDHISDHRQKKPRSKFCNFGRGILCLCGSFFELFFHLFNKLSEIFLALLARFGVYVPAYSFPVYPRRISSFVQILIKL